MSCKQFVLAAAWILLSATVGCGRSGTELNAEDAARKRERSRELSLTPAATAVAIQHEDRESMAVGSNVLTSDFTFNFRLYKRPGANSGMPVIYRKVAAGDFNGDGRIDLVFGLADNEIELVYQNGNGGFSAPQVIDTGKKNYSSAGHLVVGDFNGDGVDDIVFDTVGESGALGGVAMLRSRRGAAPELRHLHPPALYTSGSAAGGWAAVDIDGDNQLDLVALHSGPAGIADLGLWDAADPPCQENKPCHHYIVYRGDGNGGLGAPQAIMIEGPPDQYATRDFFVQDIDSDGIEEVVHSFSDWRGSHHAAYVMRLPLGANPPRPTLLHQKFSSAPLFFGDIDGDGFMDSIHGNAIFLGSANDSYSGPHGLAIYYYMESPWNAIADFDGNGRVDVVNHQFRTFGEIPYFATYLQESGGLQAPFFLYDPPTSHLVKIQDDRQAAATGDFNSDGCLDVAIPIGYSGVLLLEGRNCFGPQMQTGGNLKPRRR